MSAREEAIVLLRCAADLHALGEHFPRVTASYHLNANAEVRSLADWAFDRVGAATGNSTGFAHAALEAALLLEEQP